MCILPNAQGSKWQILYKEMNPVFFELLSCFIDQFRQIERTVPEVTLILTPESETMFLEVSSKDDNFLLVGVRKASSPFYFRI